MTVKSFRQDGVTLRVLTSCDYKLEDYGKFHDKVSFEFVETMKLIIQKPRIPVVLKDKLKAEPRNSPYKSPKMIFM